MNNCNKYFLREVNNMENRNNYEVTNNNQEYTLKTKRFLIGWIVLMAALVILGIMRGLPLINQVKSLLLITIGWWSGAYGWYLFFKYFIYAYR